MQEITIAYQRLLEQHRYKYVALYHALREGILNGTLPACSRLPSTRRLAEMYGVSRGIAAEAYDLLLAEGYVEAATGKGTYVSEQLRLLPHHTNHSRNHRNAAPCFDESQPARTLSRWGQRIVQLETIQATEAATRQETDVTAGAVHIDSERAAIAAASDPGAPSDSSASSAPSMLTLANTEANDAGVAAVQTSFSNTNVSRSTRAIDSAVAKATISSPASISFCPQELVLHRNSLADWKTALAAAAKDMQSADFAGQMDTMGDWRLREAICYHVGRTRGICAQPEQVILYSGSQEAIVMLCQLLINEHEPIVVEDPCYSGITRAIIATGGELIGADVDRQGIIPADWKARLLFVTPGRQFPTGAVLPLARRQQLLQWADRQGAWIIEDDYDSEFRWGGRPLEPLKALDHSEQVIYVGSFSKSMFSALRIGYAIVPSSLIPALIAAKKLYAPLPSSPLEQRALARFMQHGDYMRHLRRMTRLYRPRFQQLYRLLTSHLSELFDWIETDSGLHIYGSWRLERAAYERFYEQATKLGVVWKDASIYHLSAALPSVCFSFAHTDEQQIRQGVERLELAWKRTLEYRL
ncbi:PLP-dependent aminotransferase family protein [Paenibacillus campi]|uniref:aminotransferase-like domain-containing protein n=1 Tax=Paenibacillus campi TaxID=3106031 RepID=UPI002AFEFFA1|nr:PLP-dependent aminotransferase family protein [Paenibacillus sp. SGZ-1009]